MRIVLFRRAYQPYKRMATFRIYVKRSTIATYEVEAKDAQQAEDMAKTHLEAHYYLSDNPYDADKDEELDTPFVFESDDDSQEEFMSVDEA